MSKEEFDREYARIVATYGEPEDDPDDDEDLPARVETPQTASTEEPQTFHVQHKRRHYNVVLTPNGEAVSVYSTRNGSSEKQIYPPPEDTRAGDLIYDLIDQARRQQQSAGEGT